MYPLGKGPAGTQRWGADQPDRSFSVFLSKFAILTNSMERSPSEADSYSANQNIPRLLRKPKIH
jgi:hypothetical protein